MPYKDPEKQRAWQLAKYHRLRTEYFNGKKCVFCESTKDLQIDHIDRKTKISHRIWSWTPAKRMVELLKCQVLCKECHEAKTAIESMRITHGLVSTYKIKNCRCMLCRTAHALSRKNQPSRQTKYASVVSMA